MTRVVIALGSNLGDRGANLRAAVRELGQHGVRLDAWSWVWETAPVPADQPAYLNAVVAGETEIEPEPMLGVLKQIEWQLGRRPERRWGPRPIDLDLLFWGDARFESEQLTLPHPRITERGFVLAPLSEVLRGRLPVFGQTALEVLAEIGCEGLTRTGELLTDQPHRGG